MASTVGTSTAATATQYPNQRKTFYAAGLFWVWYSDGTNLVYRTSADGVNWSSATSVGACTAGIDGSVWFDGTFVHYARYASYILYYRRGTPNSNGTITWSAAEQTVYSGTSSNRHEYPMIAVDSSGYAWIGTKYYETYHYPYVFKNENNDGTWSTAENFPYQLRATSNANWKVSVVPLTAGKVYAIYSLNTLLGFGKLWSGSSWGSEETTTADAELGYGHSAVADSNDNIYLVYLNDALATGIMYNSRNAITGLWGTEATVQANATAAMCPVLSIDTATGDLYCFWAGAPDANKIYYKKNVGGTWDADPTLWLDETTDTLQTNNVLTCFRQVFNNKIGLLYTTLTASPYNIKYGFLDWAPQLIQVSDSGAGTDTVGLQASIPVTDSGAGSDAIGMQASISVSDVGAGVDGIGMSASIPVSDSGVGADVAALIISILDSGAGVDEVSSIIAQIFVSDSGLGTDVARLIIPVADSGIGSDEWKKIVQKIYPHLLKTLPGARTFVRRVASFDVDRDPVSGQRIPIFTEENIDGLLIERGGDMPGIAAGVVMTQDAIFYTLNTELDELDQIRDDTKIFQVVGIEEKFDPYGNFAYKACHLRRLELYKEEA